MKAIGYGTLTFIALAFSGLLYTASAPYQSAQPQRFVATLPMTFDHQTHSEQQCVDCHHNFIDDSGQGMCIECHVSNDPLRQDFEQQFHDLCMGCHEAQQLQSEKHGPIRECAACHTADTKP